MPFASIYRGARSDGALSSFQRVRNRWRYWTGSFDTGFAVTQGTTDTTNTSIGFRSERRKPGTRFVLGANYLFGTEKQDGGSTSTLSNEVLALTKAEYDLTPRILALGSFDAEYDEVERLSYRLVPRLGFGYRIFKSETAFFQVESAPAYVFERFFGGDEEDFFGISFGAETEVKLPYSAVFAGRIDYLPSVSDWIDDYLLRSEISLTLPLIGFVNFRAALSNQYDNTPAEGTDRNELQTTVGLSVTL